MNVFQTDNTPEEVGYDDSRITVLTEHFEELIKKKKRQVIYGSKCKDRRCQKYATDTYGVIK